MIRDANGYTALLKAAAIGRKDMIEVLIEKMGVDPRHKDPWGNTAKDKAILYSRYDLIDYLEEMENKANRGELNLIDWKDKSKIRRTGRFRTLFDY